MCISDLDTPVALRVNKFFVIKDNYLYADDTTKPPLSADKYSQARVLIDDFPAYLTDHPNQSFTCNNCADQFTLNIERRIDGVSYQWTVDLVFDNMPTELHDYIRDANQLSRQLLQ